MRNITLGLVSFLTVINVSVSGASANTNWQHSDLIKDIGGFREFAVRPPGNKNWHPAYTRSCRHLPKHDASWTLYYQTPSGWIRVTSSQDKRIRPFLQTVCSRQAIWTDK